MFISANFLTAITLSLAAVVTAQQVFCDGLSPQWHNQSAVIGDIKAACVESPSGGPGYFENMYFQPWLTYPYSKGFCTNGGGRHVLFEIANIKPTIAATMDESTCVTGFIGIVTRCAEGGNSTSSQNRWFFRVNSLAGSC